MGILNNQVNPTATEQITGVVARKQPGIGLPDGTAGTPFRLDAYGSLFPGSGRCPTRHAFADESSYWIASGPQGGGAPLPIGTGIPVQGTPTFWPGAPLLIVQNTAQAGAANATSIYLDMVQMIATAVATAATSIRYAVLLDGLQTVDLSGSQRPFYILDVSSANTLSKPPANVQVLSPYGGNTVSISGSAVRVASGALGGLNVVGTQMDVAFGTTDLGCYAGVAETQPGRRGSSAAPVIVPPQSSAYFYIWTPGSSVSLAPETMVSGWVR
jgi:hypothetical protein